ncbi:hypothetical protein AV941_01665 [Alteromonas mediterranea]|nr:hypothetical protein AV941_01665 [Alteromonas mediterranea]
MLKKIIYQAAVLLLILPSIAMANIHHGANDVFELLVYKSKSIAINDGYVVLSKRSLRLYESRVLN